MSLPRPFVLIPSILLMVASLSAQTHKPAAKPKAVADEKCGPIADQLLRCPKFGFAYKVIFGWVDRTADMQPDTTLSDQLQNSDKESSSPTASAADQPKTASSDSSQTLLAVFERPPAAPGDTINSAVVIAAEPLANYHGIRIAADYLNPISELAEQRGFKTINPPYAFAVGTTQLARADFSKERGKLTMCQSSMVMIEKGYIVSFTFIGGSEDEVDELIGSLTFAARKPVSPTGKAVR